MLTRALQVNLFGAHSFGAPMALRWRSVNAAQVHSRHLVKKICAALETLQSVPTFLTCVMVRGSRSRPRAPTELDVLASPGFGAQLEDIARVRTSLNFAYAAQSSRDFAVIC
jgi:hypothetical protein